MGIIKSRKNKKFDYSPRYYKNDGEGSPYSIKHKFDEYRSTVGGNSGLKNKFKTAWEDLQQSKNRRANRTIILIVAIFIFIFLYIIDFDLSIFYQN
ncbi:riboflavin synthase subunit beta [uncultured Marixanthomonas sp.]|uniref:riboflavin synthase subunit beta n=1 Tax=uncultured Marixanthomonas sp. TaxID=757245 RepID=UPI0030D9868F|tara:strand:- start:23782 stop:24069 length:288 start_codon:yes stop_codon:yes gene_type:complete